MSSRFLLLAFALCGACRSNTPTAGVDAGPVKRGSISAPRSCSTFERCLAACEGGQGGACYDASVFAFSQRLDAGRDLTQVARLAGLACDRGDGRGCVRAARLEEAGQRLPGQCEAGEVEACELLVTWAHEADAGTLATTAAQKTVALLEAACARPEPWACSRLGSMLARGRLVKAEPARGVKLLERACELGVAGACLEATLIFTRGLSGVEPDPARAAKWGRSARELSGAASE